jgi:hypothetical protein
MREKMIHAHMATFAPRVRQAATVIRAIEGQVTTLTVVLNGMKSVPETWLRRSHIIYHLSPIDTADTGKFIGHSPGYNLTIDDDLYYPPNYVARTVRAIDAFDRRYPVAWAGKRLLPLEEFPPYHGGLPFVALNIRRFSSTGTPQAVHIPLTNLFAYHTETIGPISLDVSWSFMTDIGAAVAVRNAENFVVVPPKDGKWIGQQEYDVPTSIWERQKTSGSRKEDEILTDNAPWPDLPDLAYSRL